MAERVRKHVKQCATCRQELAEKTQPATEKKAYFSSRSSETINNRGPHDISASGIKLEESDHLAAAMERDIFPVLSQVQLSIGGMTCAACTSAITQAVSDLQGVTDVSVNLLGKSASAVVAQLELVDAIVTRVEEIGYDCVVVSVDPVSPLRRSGAGNQLAREAIQKSNVVDTELAPRVVAIKINGMFCQ